MPVEGREEQAEEIQDVWKEVIAFVGDYALCPAQRRSEYV